MSTRANPDINNRMVSAFPLSKCYKMLLYQSDPTKLSISDPTSERMLSISVKGGLVETGSIGTCNPPKPFHETATRVVIPHLTFVVSGSTGGNAKLRYQITSGNTGGVFDVEPEVGTIFIAQPLDYEQNKR